ncbi:MAG: sugar transferase [Sphingomonas sp.]|uniref:sugar transferase n=1 Tax=Sphingomonas sp. TaxID=28214 RepID=UPI0025F44930|nr:sugar transferase [Sphingomonas sp.]MBX3565266.1 sugar transferase [Sphingomonas sp.]
MPPIAKARRSGSYTGTNLWNRARTQLGGVILFAVLLPTVVLGFFYDDFLQAAASQQTLLGVTLAASLSVLLVRNISLHPGIKSAFFAFPSVLICFALTFSLFLLFRIEYGRALFLTSGVVTLVWLYIVEIMVERGPALSVGIVPFGEVSMLAGVSKLELHWLSEPKAETDYDMLIADFRADLPDDWETFLADCALAGIPVLHVKQLHESLTGRVEIEHLSENSFGSLVPYIGYLRLRRGFDFIAAALAAVLLMPVFVMVSVAIKLDSRGPVLFRQARIGYRGAPFQVAKFRTMIADRNEEDARAGAMTLDNDVRITKLGRILRRTRIDELPQILNILRGEMSWIGPRPEAEVLSRWYESELPFYRYRHIVPPGITGWAQVTQGHVAELDQVMSKLHYDFYYIKNFSPWLDALIVAKTVQTMVTGFGSR